MEKCSTQVVIKEMQSKGKFLKIKLTQVYSMYL